MYLTLKDTKGKPLKVSIAIDTLPTMWVVQEDGFRQRASELNTENRRRIDAFMKKLLKKAKATTTNYED
jgi:hypothetical protein